MGIMAERIPAQNMTPIVIGPGDVEVVGKQVFAEGRPVRVEPGTHLLLHINAALVIRGPFTMVGSPEAPITVAPMVPGHATGGIQLVGRHTAPSRIAHVRLTSGSGMRMLNLRFAGMLSIHDCPDAAIEDVLFTDAPCCSRRVARSVSAIALHRRSGSAETGRGLFRTVCMERRRIPVTPVHGETRITDLFVTGGDAGGSLGGSRMRLMHSNWGAAGGGAGKGAGRRFLSLGAGSRGDENGNWRWGGPGQLVNQAQSNSGFDLLRGS